MLLRVPASLGSVHQETQHCHSEPFGKPQDRLREESPRKARAKRFFVVPPLAGLLRMTTEKGKSEWTRSYLVGRKCWGSPSRNSPLLIHFFRVSAISFALGKLESGTACTSLPLKRKEPLFSLA